MTDSKYKGPTDSKSSGSGSTLIKDWYTGKLGTRTRHPSEQVEMTSMDRELLLDMSKVLVALGTKQNTSKWAGDLALTQYRYRQKFFPDTIEP